MVPQYCHYSTASSEKLFQGFLVVCIFSFLPPSLGFAGVKKENPFWDDQFDINDYTLCCPNGVNYATVFRKSYVDDGLQFDSEEPIENLEEVTKLGSCCLIDENGISFYDNFDINPTTGVWLYRNDLNPFGMNLALGKTERFVQMYNNGKIERIFIGIQLGTDPETISLKIIGNLPPLTDDNEFSVSHSPNEFGDLISYKMVRKGEFELRKIQTRYYRWTPIPASDFFKLDKVDSIEKIVSLPIDHRADVTYMEGFECQFCPWVIRGGVSTNWEFKKITVEELRTQPKFPWFIHVYVGPFLMNVLVGEIDPEAVSNESFIPFAEYVGKPRRYTVPEEVLLAGANGLSPCNYAVSRTLDLLNVKATWVWNSSAEYFESEGQLLSLHIIANIYALQYGIDLLFCGTFKFFTEEVGKFHSKEKFSQLRCKPDYPMCPCPLNGFTIGVEYLVDLNGQAFIKAQYIGTEPGEATYLFRITGTEEIYGGEAPIDNVVYVYISTTLGLYYRLKANRSESDSITKLELHGELPFDSDDSDEYNFAISTQKALRVPDDAKSFNSDQIKAQASIILIEHDNNHGLVPCLDAAVPPKANSSDGNIEAESIEVGPPTTSSTRSEPELLPRTTIRSVINANEATSNVSTVDKGGPPECLLYECNQYGEITKEKGPIKLSPLRLPFSNVLYRVICPSGVDHYIKDYPNLDAEEGKSVEQNKYCFGIPIVKPAPVPQEYSLVYANGQGIPQMTYVVEKFQPPRGPPEDLLSAKFYRRINQADFLPLDVESGLQNNYRLLHPLTNEQTVVKPFLVNESSFVFMEVFNTDRFPLHTISNSYGHLGEALSEVTPRVDRHGSVGYYTDDNVEYDLLATYMVLGINPIKPVGVEVSYYCFGEEGKVGFHAPLTTDSTLVKLKNGKMYMHAYSEQGVFLHSLIVKKGLWRPNRRYKVVTEGGFSGRSNTPMNQKYILSHCRLPRAHSTNCQLYKCANTKCDAFVKKI